MASLKIGDRVRWKVTSSFILTTVEGQRAEVLNIVRDVRGDLITDFRNLDNQGETEHTFVVIGEIPEETYETIV